MTIGGIEFDWQITLVIIICTVIPMLDWYGHQITGTAVINRIISPLSPVLENIGYHGQHVKAYDRIIWYFLIPALTIVLLFREPIGDYGFQIGNWRIGLAWTVGVCIIMAGILYFVAQTESMAAYYEIRTPKTVGRIFFFTGVDLFGWEFFWRGFMLFALARAFGPGAAIWLQAIPFAFMHLGKPELETLTTLFGGVGFGFIAWQSQSFFYPFLIHWFIASFTMLVATGRI